MSNLLMNEKPLMVLLKTATAIGLNDYESLERLEREIFEKEDNPLFKMSRPPVQNEQTPLFKMSRPPVQNEQSNTIDYTETTTESTHKDKRAKNALMNIQINF